MSKTYVLETAKEAHHFSCCHMATFADGSIERLHGHNYRVRARLSGGLDPAGMVLDVIVFKKMIHAICRELDEHLLVPLHNPLIAVREEPERVLLDYAGKHYEVPREDCLLLDIANTTMEHLADWFAERLARDLEHELGYRRMNELHVSISETPGQWAGWTLDLQRFWGGAA